MSFFDVIKNLKIQLSPSWPKSNGDNATNSKVKAKKVTGDVAGRDIHKTYVKQPTKKAEPPYVYVEGSFGGNGHVMRFQACRTHNLSDQFVFLEHIEVLGRTINFNDHLVKAGESIMHTGIDDLSYPTSQKPQYLEIYFHAKNGKKFVAKQQLSFGSRADAKFSVTGLSKPTIKALKP